MKAPKAKSSACLESMARALIDKIDDTKILSSRKLADDTKRLRILKMRKELNSLLNSSE